MRRVRLASEIRADYSGDSATYRWIEAKLGCSSSTLRGWRIQAARDVGVQPRMSSDDMTRIKEPEREHQMRK